MTSYAAAEITFIDRSTGLKTAYCYPVRENPEQRK